MDGPSVDLQGAGPAIRQVAGVKVPFGEAEEIARQARIAQVASAKNDPGRREQRRDQPGKKDVVRHRVYDANRSAPERLQILAMREKGEPATRDGEGAARCGATLTA